MEIKRRYIVMIALFLAVMMAGYSPVKVLAQTRNQTQTQSQEEPQTQEETQTQEESEPQRQYVKELRISWDKKDENKAKKWLTDKGYQVVPQDLNAGTGKGYSYLGYKTTTNADEAITDVSMMDMSGGFETLDYRSMAEKMAPNAKQMATEMMAACQEFRENLKAGSPEAKLAKSVLDIFVVEEDNNRPLGDYLLDEKRKMGDFYDIILMTHSLVSTYIYNQLTLGTADYQKDNWMKRLSDMGPVEIDSKKDIWSAKERQVMDKAENLSVAVQTFSQNYRAAKERQKKNDGEVAETAKTEEEAEAEAKKLAKGEKICDEKDDVLYLATYKVLKQYSYDDTNLADFLVEVGKEKSVDSSKLYGLAQCLTEGQYGMMRVTGITSAVMVTDNTEQSCKQGWENHPEMEKQLKDALNGKAPTLWVGTNREIFNQKVALTQGASREAAAKGNYDALTQDNTMPEKLRQVMLCAGGVALVSLGVALLVATGFAIFFESTIAMAAVALYTSIGTTVGSTAMGVAGCAGPVALAIVALAIVLVAAIWYGTLALMDLWDYYHPEYTSIPNAMYDYKSKCYLGYHAVLDQNGEPADLNNKEGLEWNALYATTDKSAGSPLVADEKGNIFTVKKGGDQNIPKGYEPLTKFGESVPANTNDHAYDDDENGIFLYHHTVKSLAEAELNQGEEVTDENTQYIESIVLASEKTEQAAKLNIKVRTGYKLIDYNLTKGQKNTATYIGYKTTEDATEAIRDIRVAYGTTATEYLWGSSVYANAGTVNGISLYYSAYVTTGDPILADIVITDSLSKRPKGYEPVNLFCGGEAFDMNTYDEESVSDWSRHSYIFFHPSVEYTSGTKYISGFNFVGGMNEKNDPMVACTPDEYIKELGLTDTGMNMSENCVWYTIAFIFYKQAMKLCYTTTYNPHRAIYDVKVHEAELSATALAGNITFDGMGYSACEVYTQHLYKYWPKRYRKIRSSHAYISNNEEEKEYHQEKLVFPDKYYPGNKVESVVPCRGMYVRGPEAVLAGEEYSADYKAPIPLTLEDVKFSRSSNCPSGFVSVKKMSDVYNTSSYNLGMGKHRWETWVPWIPNRDYSGSYIYMYLKGEEPKKKKYIKSIKVVYDETKDMSKEMCMYKLYAAGGDEIIDFNLATYTGAAELDDYKEENKTHIELKQTYKKKLKLDKDYKDKSAYIRVTRTDKRHEAIQNIVIYKADENASVPPKTYEKNNITYTRCGEWEITPPKEKGKEGTKTFTGKIKGKNGNFYLYTSYIGRQLRDINFERTPIVNGSTTFLDQNGKADASDPWWMQSPGSSELKFIKSVGVTAVYPVGLHASPEATAMCNLLSQGCTDYFVNFDFNYNGAGIKRIYMGYSKTNKKDEAIKDLIARHDNSGGNSMKYNGNTYTRVGTTELNASAGGDYIWLYSTKDASAGSPLAEIQGVSTYEIQQSEIVWKKIFGGSLSSEKKYEYLMRTDGGISDLNAGVTVGGCSKDKDFRCRMKINRSDNSIKQGATSASSIFAVPNLIVIIVLAVLMVGIGGGIIIVRKRKRKKKSSSKGAGMMLLFLIVAAGWMLQGKPAEAAGSYVTELALKSGDDAQEKLKEKGYTVLPQGMNLIWQDGKKAYSVEGKARIYLAYGSGTDKSRAITDLVTTSGKNPSKTLTHNGISYTLLSDVSLNNGVDGDDIYLYYTRDRKAGEPILDFDFSAYQKEASDDFSGYALLGDGSSPVRSTTGEVSNLDGGREGLELYLMMVRDNRYLPYISDVHVASASSKRVAVRKVAALGCDYYISADMNSTDGTYVVLGYQRTADKKEAITGVIGNRKKNLELAEKGITYQMAEPVLLRGKVEKGEPVSYYLYYTKDHKAGNPVIDVVSDREKKEKKVIYGEWVKSCFEANLGVARTYLIQEESYQKAMEDTAKFEKTNIVVTGEKEPVVVNLSILQSENKEEKADETEQKREETVTPTPTAAATPEVKSTEEPEQAEEKKADSEEKETVSGSAVKNNEATASVLGEGGLEAIKISMIILIVLCAVGGFVWMKRK